MIIEEAIVTLSLLYTEYIIGNKYTMRINQYTAILPI